MAKIGFDRLIFSLMTEHVVIGRPAGHGIISNYPDEWMKYYNAKGYAALDPVRSKMFGSHVPFRWKEFNDFNRYSGAQVKVIHEGREAGLYQGIGIPLRGARGAIAGIGAASSNEQIDLNPVVVAKANMLSVQFYAVYTMLESNQPLTTAISLTNREQEVLQWSAVGKTRQEIAVILGISKHTVNIHVASVLKKFSTDNIIVAAFKALHAGLIQV